jgi:hypothetical protein
MVRRDIVIAAPDGTSQVVYGGVGAWTIEAFALDDRRMLLQYLSINRRSCSNSICRAALRPVAGRRKNDRNRRSRYGSDTNTIYFSADIGAEFVRLHRLDRSTGHLRS